MPASKPFAVLVLAAVLSVASVVAAEPRGAPHGETAEDPSRERDGDRDKAQRGSGSSDAGSGGDGSSEASSAPDRRDREGEPETADQRSGGASGDGPKGSEGDHEPEGGPTESPDRRRGDRGPARAEAARAPADTARAAGGTGEQARDQVLQAGAPDTGPTPTRSGASEEGDPVREQPPEPALERDEGRSAEHPASAPEHEGDPPRPPASIVTASVIPSEVRPPAPHDLQRHAQPETGAQAPSADGVSVEAPGPMVGLAAEGAAEAWAPMLVPFLAGAALSAVVCRRVLSRSQRGGQDRPALPPAGAEGLIVLAREARRQGDEDEAIEWMRMAAGARPANIDVQLSLAELLVELDAQEEGVEVIREVLTLEPCVPEERYRCARLLAAAGATRQAVDELAHLRSEEAFMERAREDAAFDEFRDHPLFLELLGELDLARPPLPARSPGGR